jgi:hypothetical protein
MASASYQTSWRSIAVAIVLFTTVFLVGLFIGETRKSGAGASPTITQ